MNENEIKVIASSAEVTAFKKRLSFEYKGELHHATLYWDENDGYDLIFKNKSNSTPNWALDYEGAESLEYILDCLSINKVSA